MRTVKYKLSPVAGWVKFTRVWTGRLCEHCTTPATILVEHEFDTLYLCDWDATDPKEKHTMEFRIDLVGPDHTKYLMEFPECYTHIVILGRGHTAQESLWDLVEWGARIKLPMEMLNMLEEAIKALEHEGIPKTHHETYYTALVYRIEPVEPDLT